VILSERANQSGQLLVTFEHDRGDFEYGLAGLDFRRHREQLGLISHHPQSSRYRYYRRRGHDHDSVRLSLGVFLSLLLVSIAWMKMQLRK
jgi:hypothetical protein